MGISSLFGRMANADGMRIELLLLKQKLSGKTMQNLQSIPQILLGFLVLVNAGIGQGWQFRSSMPTARNGMAVVVLDNKAWVMGGSQMGQNALNVVEVYDPQTDSWDTQQPPLSIARDHATAQVWEGKIYVFGGQNSSQVVEQVEMFDPTLGQWQVVSSMPTPRYGMASVQVDSAIWLIGGTTAGQTFSDIVEIYYPGSNSWETLPATLNFARGDPMAGVLNGEVYVFGGIYFGPLDNYEKFDSASQSWTVEGNMLFGCGSAGYVTVGNQAWLIGGMRQGGAFNRVQIFNPGAGARWSEGPPLNTPRRELSAAAVENQIIAVGGRGSMGGMSFNTVEVLDAVLSIEDDLAAVPEDFALLRNFPNPFNGFTILQLHLPKSDVVHIQVYDIRGRRLGVIFKGPLSPGDHYFKISPDEFSGLQLSSGVYLVRANGQKFNKNLKIHLIK